MSAEELELRWYLCLTKQGKEVMASKAVERVCAEVFLPLFYQRPEKKPEPVFPRYIFVRVDSKRRLLAVAYSAGMRDVLTAPEPTEVPDSLVTELQVASAVRHQERRDAALVSDSVRGMFDRRMVTMERVVALFRLIEERKALEASGCH